MISLSRVLLLSGILGVAGCVSPRVEKEIIYVPSPLEGARVQDWSFHEYSLSYPLRYQKQELKALCLGFLPGLTPLTPKVYRSCIQSL